MTDITAQLIKIQSEEVDYRSAVSEGTMTRIGAAINWIIENTSQHVGDVQASMLTEAQFQAKRDSKWVLMDGRDVTGSDYATLTGSSTIPDARATVLRMKDNARALDPAGDPDLGDYQADEVLSHRHFMASSSTVTPGTLNSTRQTSRLDSGGFTLLYPTTGAADIGRTSLTGGLENRVKSTIINYFIKIND
jgi:hypothetical protein